MLSLLVATPSRLVHTSPSFCPLLSACCFLSRVYLPVRARLHMSFGVVVAHSLLFVCCPHASMPLIAPCGRVRVCVHRRAQMTGTLLLRAVASIVRLVHVCFRVLLDDFAPSPLLTHSLVSGASLSLLAVMLGSCQPILVRREGDRVPNNTANPFLVFV